MVYFYLKHPGKFKQMPQLTKSEHVVELSTIF